MHRMIAHSFSIFFVLSSLVFAGCQKKETSPKTKTQLITESPWKFSQAGIDQNGDGKIDLALPAGILEPCATDNLYTFKADHTGTVDEGPSKCSTSNPQTVPFTWNFLNNESQIDISTPLVAGIDGPVNIVELTETRFTLSKSVTLKGIPIPLTVVVILVH